MAVVVSFCLRSKQNEKKSRRYRQLTIVDYKKSFYQKSNRIFRLVLSKAYCDEHQKLDEFTQTTHNVFFYISSMTLSTTTKLIWHSDQGRR